MIEITDQQFNDLIAETLDELPKEYTSKLDNLVITYEDQPTAEQRERLKLRGHETLFGLFEGLPMTGRTNYGTALPSRITIFKLPMLYATNRLEELRAQIKHTLWHEIAHYFGLNHDRIHEIERNWQ